MNVMTPKKRRTQVITHKRWDGVTLGVVLLLIVSATGCGGGNNSPKVSAPKPQTYTITGTAVMDYNVAFPSGAAHECQRYPFEKHDIESAAQTASLQVFDESDTLIATGSLDQKANIDCMVAYSIPNVPKANFYTVAINIHVSNPIPGFGGAASGTFKTDPTSFDGMVANDWTVPLVLQSS